MSAHDTTLFGDQIAASRMGERFAAMDPVPLLQLSIEHLFAHRIALVSSFGADSAVLLHMAASIDKDLPVVFIDTQQLFPQTLGYRDQLVGLLGMRDVRTIRPDPAGLVARDADAFLWAGDPDACCDLRKVEPLARAMDGFDAWITGRKRHQAATRSALALFEAEGERIKINPLSAWSNRDVLDYLSKTGLPPHPLVARGFKSIGCSPCTSPVREGEDPRAGRWRGQGKLECGIHLGTLDAGSDI